MSAMPGQDVCLESVATFDRLAERYAAKYFDLQLYDAYLERFAGCVTHHGAHVLDVACGPGNVSAYLARSRPDIQLVGIDLAEGMIAQARRRVPAARFAVQDCRSIDLGMQFDAAALAFGLSYLADDDAQRFFASLGAVLRPDAVLYLSTITGDPAWSGFDTSSSGDRVYMCYRQPDEVIALVERAGYQVDFTELLDSPANAPRATRDLVLIARRTRTCP